MPRHCGLCRSLAVCRKNNPDKICSWLKKSRKMIKVLKIIVFFSLFFSSYSAFALTQLSVSAVTASSSSGTYTASKATDNNLSTYWQGATSKTPYWLNLDLGKSSSLYQLSILWDKTYGSTNYNIQVSSNGTSWTNVYTGLSSSGGTTNPYQLNSKLFGSYRYVRIYINTLQRTYPIIYEAKLYADTTAPTGTVKINSNAQYTKSTGVTLNLSATDSDSGLAQMQFSNDNKTWSTPETYATTKNWTLTTGDGTKTVYVKYKDVAGNWSTPVSSTIILDTTVPATTISGVDGLWHNSSVTITLNPSDTGSGIDKIYYSTDGTSPTLIYTAPFTLTNEGTYTIKYYSLDKAGNAEAIKTCANQVKIDTTAPSGSVQVNNGAQGIDSTSVTLTLNATDSGSGLAQMQFSNDNTTWSTLEIYATTKNWTLAAGNGTKTVYAKFIDVAGNAGIASANAYLYTGALIGPDGGEVSSPDNKVKLIIPQGALTSPQQIEVLTVNKDSLEGAQPSGTSLLSVVECKPYGLVFNKPVSLVYSLDYAEIPGTPVELGLYDSVQKKIISTGQTSTVPADGYTLTFSIMHFSTYAALVNLIPQSTPIGSGVKIPLPDMFTGAFSHAIPITIPPGRKGMQPAIGLTYHSSNPNSWVGLGFSLNPGYIVRSTKLGPPTYDDTKDTFYFITDAGTTELVHLIDNLYQAKIESSFNRFFKQPDDSWKVVGKDGSILMFGQTADSKETSPSGTFSWYVTRATDTNGNYIAFSYTKDQGKVYLSRIDYTGNDVGISPTNSVEFILDSRDDIISSYVSTAKIATTKRLKEIDIKVNSDLVWRYVLAYTASPDTNRSLLASVTQSASDNKNLPVQRFTYQKQAP